MADRPRLGCKVWSHFGDDADHKRGGVVIDIAEQADPEDGEILVIFTVIDPRPGENGWRSQLIDDGEIDPAATEPYSVRTVRNLRRRIHKTLADRYGPSPPGDLQLEAFTSRLAAIEWGVDL